ncbi:MAG: hypothetical protein ACREA9_26645 [Pyrinomonadaceae bacterium]
MIEKRLQRILRANSDEFRVRKRLSSMEKRRPCLMMAQTGLPSLNLIRKAVFAIKKIGHAQVAVEEAL